MNEFSQLLQVVHDMRHTIQLQQLQIEVMREQVAELTEQLYGNPEQPPIEDQAA